MENGEQQARDAVLDAVRGHGDRAAEYARALAPLAVRRAEELYAGHRAAVSRPELFVRSRSFARSQPSDLVERSIRAEFATALGVSEGVASRELERAQLLMEDLPLTRAALEQARMLWEAGTVICSGAGTLPKGSRAAFDEAAVGLAETMTPTQLKKALARVRDELHEQPLNERHAAAREARDVYVTADHDGMATLSALLPAHIAVAAFNRLDGIARSLRSEEDEQRTLAQLRADAAGDILCDGDITGTTPIDDASTPAPTFVPGVRAEVRIVVPVLTAAGRSDEPAELDGYGPIPADVARELVGTGSAFYRVLVDPVTCMVTSVGRLLRMPPALMRRYLQLRDQTCRFPGCTRKATSAEVDHTIEWRNGGCTEIANLLHLCVAHHHVRHGDQWSYVLHPDGTADWTTPTGRRVTTKPPPLPGSSLRPRFTDSPPRPIFDPEPFVGSAPF